MAKDVRKVVALEKAKAQTEEEAISDPIKSKVYYKYMDAGQVGMVGHFDSKGDYIKGIEDYIPNVQYQTEEHTTTVVKDMFNEMFVEEDNLIFVNHLPGEGTDLIYVYNLTSKSFIIHGEPYTERTLNGESKVVVNKDGQDIIVF